MKDLIKIIADFLKVISDPMRLEILILIKEGGKTQVDIHNATDKPQPTISQHLKALQNENLIEFSKVENVKYYSVKDPKIFKILSLIVHYLKDLYKEKYQSIFSDVSLFDTLLF